jgi:hypothetical protein
MGMEPDGPVINPFKMVYTTFSIQFEPLREG